MLYTIEKKTSPSHDLEIFSSFVCPRTTVWTREERKIFILERIFRLMGMKNSFTVQNKCGNFGFYPKVMCTTKSVWDRWVILECLDTKIIMTNLFMTTVSVDCCTSVRIWDRIQLIFELAAFIYHKTTIFVITWFLLVTAQLMEFRGKWSTDSSSLTQKTSK